MVDDAVPIKPRDFLRRHPSRRRGYSVAQPFLGVPLMPDPNQPNPQAQTNPPQPAPQAAPQQQAAAGDGGRLQQIVEFLKQFGPGALQFLELFVQHLQPTPVTPPFAAAAQQDPADAWLENAAFNAAQACKAKQK
jgi:hypothetical protein